MTSCLPVLDIIILLSVRQIEIPTRVCRLYQSVPTKYKVWAQVWLKTVSILEKIFNLPPITLASHFCVSCGQRLHGNQFKGFACCICVSAKSACIISKTWPQGNQMVFLSIQCPHCSGTRTAIFTCMGVPFRLTGSPARFHRTMCFHCGLLWVWESTDFCTPSHTQKV